MSAIKNWLGPQLANAPVELTIVGDIEIAEVREIVSRTFGMLPTRRAAVSFSERRTMPEMASGTRGDYEIDTQVPKSLVLIAYPATDGMDTMTRRSMSMLSTVLNDRLRLEVRERLGAAYSPGAGSEFSTVYPDNGMIFIQAMSDPDKVETLVEACLDTADTLATNGVTEEEVTRLREPIANQLRDQLRTNSYWLGALAESHWRPESLDDARSVQQFYANVSAEQVAPLAAKYFKRDLANVCVVSPKATE
jgi:zinc protease